MKIKRQMCRWGVLLFLFTASYSALAQDVDSVQVVAPEEVVMVEDDIFNLSLEELLNFQVTTGSFLNLDFQNSAASLSIIKQEQIEASGAKNMSEVLEIYVPGFQYMINKWNGVIWGMRGVAADRNTKFIVLVNGHKMNTESRDGAMTELDLGLLDDVKRIEVVRGPGGLVYGSGAIAGVINIVTKKFEEDEVRISSRMQTWSMNTFGQEYQATIAKKIDEDVSIKVDLGYRQSQGVGVENSRLYGRPHWPYPQWLSNPPQEGMPTNGSAQSTPGNGKAAIDFDYKGLNIYSRWTHQVTNGSGWFNVDPWPEVLGNPDSTASDRWVNGKPQAYDSFYASTESWGTNRRQYVYDNISTQATYDVPIGANEIKLRAGVDAMTNRIQREEMKAYSSLAADERNTVIDETFGERRYNLGATYLLTSKERLQLALGYEFRLYDIGDDITGKNSQAEKVSHPIVSDVTYLYNSLYGEGLYEVSDKLDAHFGLRYDLHSRTIEQGGVLNPKLGVIYKPSTNHRVKLVFQQSANNGSADNYEFNRNSIGDDGKPFAGVDYHYENPFNPPTASTPVIPPVTEDILHQLKPERSQSVELMTFHQLSKGLIVMPSVSYNKISDLFAWNQALFRVTNAGSYDFINVDLDVQYSSDKWVVGFNHTMQRMLGMDVKAQEIETVTPVFSGYDSTLVGTSYKYTPKKAVAADGSDSTVTTYINPIRDGITVDGTNFLNLNTHVSKLFVDFKPTSWLTVHTSARVFWGLAGRKQIHEYDSTNTNPALEDFKGAYANNKQYPYLGIHEAPMVKWNIGVVVKASEQLTLSFHVYDVLAGNGSSPSINSLRWQQSGNSKEHTDLFAVDYRSYGIKLNYLF